MAVAMLSTTAMAEITKESGAIKISNGQKIAVKMEDFSQRVTRKSDKGTSTQTFKLGVTNRDEADKMADELKYDDAARKKLIEEFNYNINTFDFTEENFSVRYKFSKGQNLLNKFEFDGKGDLLMSFKNASNPHEDRPNVVLQELSVRSRRTLYEFDGKTKTMRSGQEFHFNVRDNYFYEVLEDGTLNEDTPYSFNTSQKNFIVVGSSDEATELDQYNFYPEDRKYKLKKISGSEDVYKMDVEYSGDIIDRLSGRIYVGDVVKFDLPQDLTDDVRKVIRANDDATIEPVQIVLEGFSNSFTIRLNPEYIGDVESENLKIYTIENGKIAPSGLKWNKNDYVWEGKINKSTTYLISDIALKGTPAGGSSNTQNSYNPSTGVNVNVVSAVIK